VFTTKQPAKGMRTASCINYSPLFLQPIFNRLLNDSAGMLSTAHDNIKNFVDLSQHFFSYLMVNGMIVPLVPAVSEPVEDMI